MPAIRFGDGVTLPVYVANFVLMGYGEGAIFGCPAHDQRDLDFARKYGLPVIPGGAPHGAEPRNSRSATRPISRARATIDDQFATSSTGMTVAEAKEEIARRLEAGTAPASGR